MKDETTDKISQLYDWICKCDDCPLSETNKQTVPGVGNIHKPDIMFIGEAPGEDEDLTGVPFVGKAGQLLTSVIGAMGYQRHQVYITNIVKCRPPENRDPNQDEVNECFPYLEKQIDLIDPLLIVTLGLPATKAVLGLDDKVKMGDLRNQWHKYPLIEDDPDTPVKYVMPTYHPSYILRTGERNKDKVWQDMEMVLNGIKKMKEYYQ